MKGLPLHVTEVAFLIRAGFLAEEQRNDVEALSAAVLSVFHQALEEIRDVVDRGGMIIPGLGRYV